MPNINDLMNMAEALEKSPVIVVHDRCVVVRNRNATCRKCVKACQVEAIDVYANQIELDAGACMACGACTAVCPTEALVSVSPLDADLYRAAAQSALENDGQAVIACARISSKRQGDPSKYVEVPCLARLDESIVLDLVAHGVSDVLFVDGTCSTCKYQSCVPFIDLTVQYANELIAGQGGSARVSRVSSFPENLLLESAEGVFGSTRRGFFSDAATMAKETAMAAAKATIEQELGFVQEETPIGERLRVTESGTMPRLSMRRHDATINAMDMIGPPCADFIDTRRFGSVDIDIVKCNACGMCAVFCPTGALMRDEAEKLGAELRYLEFSACDCVQCGLCADVCWKGALKLSSTVSLDELFDFEPRRFDLTNAARKKKSPFA